MWIVLEVQETAFQSFTDNLRVHGVITEAKIDIGSHHTHVISPGDEVEVTREGGLPKADLNLLKETLAAGSRAKAGLIVVESDEILIFEVTARGIRDVSQFSMRGAEKGRTTQPECAVASQRESQRRSGWFYPTNCLW